MKRAIFVAGAAALACGPLLFRRARAENARYAVMHSDAEWRRILGPDRFEILRRNGTEPPNSSPLLAEHRSGMYRCAGCARDLFSSSTKYDSGDGWPSFYRPLPGALLSRADYQLIEPRTEVHCSRCGGHLGHIFNDGPRPTGLRYCIDGLALRFTAA